MQPTFAGLHACKIVQPVAFTPSREPACRLIACRLIVSPRGIPVADVGRKKRSEAFGSDRNNAGGLALTLARSRGPSKGIISTVLGCSIVNDNVLYHSLKISR
jgi:hypothetical protein